MRLFRFPLLSLWLLFMATASPQCQEFTPRERAMFDLLCFHIHVFIERIKLDQAITSEQRKKFLDKYFRGQQKLTDLHKSVIYQNVDYHTSRSLEVSLIRKVLRFDLVSAKELLLTYQENGWNLVASFLLKNAQKKYERQGVWFFLPL